MSSSKIWGVVSCAVGAMCLFAACGTTKDIDEDESRLNSQSNQLIQIPANSGVVTLAGTGQRGAADNASAVNGTFNDPAAVAVKASDGTIYVADWGNNSIRRITNAGILDTYLNGRPNLIVNSRSEESGGWTFGPAGTWSHTSRDLCGSSCGFAFDGTYWLKGIGNAPSWGLDNFANQRLGTALQPYLSEIAAGNLALRFSAMFRSPGSGGAQMALDFWSGTQRFVEGVPQNGAASATWKRIGHSCGQLPQAGPTGFCQMPPTTTSITAILGAPPTGVHYDAVQFRVIKIGATFAQDAGLVGPAALDVAANGDLYIGDQDGLMIVNASRTVSNRISIVGGVSNVELASDGTAYLVEPTQPLLRVRSPGGLMYFANVEGEPNGEPTSVAVSTVGNVHRLKIIYRGYVRVWTYDCPIPSPAVSGATVVCSNMTSVGLLKGFVDDVDGTPGSERFGYMNALSMGLYGDTIIADETNHAIRRHFFPLTNTPGGSGVKGFLNGAASVAKFSSPSGIAVTSDGSIIVADRVNNRIRKILCGAINACATSAGSCRTTPVEDNNSCTNETCFVLGMRRETASDGDSCDDGNACTNDLDCRAGECVGTPVATNDGNACTVDGCIPSTGIFHTPVGVNDNNACTLDSCSPATGPSHTPVPIDDGDGCTVDACDTLLGISHTVVNINDNNACTVDACDPATGSITHTPLVIDDANLCTVDSCNPATGTISHQPKTWVDENLADCSVPACESATGNKIIVDAPEGVACGTSGNNRFCNHAGVCESPTPVFAPPSLPGGVATDFDDLTDGLWTSVNGSQPIQTGVAANKIEKGRAGWLIGTVKTGAGNAMPNVKVTIAGDAGYGQTITRKDGNFDLIVNGGRRYTVRFEKPGHLPADRQVYVGWEETQIVPNVVLVTLDPNVTSLNLGTNGAGSAVQQVATGSPVQDDDGARTGRLLVPAGFRATMNGSDLSAMNLRITEYTVGVDGPARMPAALPPASAYTYAIELSADEALSPTGEGPANVTFNKPAYYYVDNFINGTLPAEPHPVVGTKVPSGYYDRNRRAWVPSTNGVVLKVVKGKQGVAPGLPAEVDVTGDGIKDELLAPSATPALLALGFTSAELLSLQTTYDDGKTLWRIPIDHMTPWDFNFARGMSCEGASCGGSLVSVSAPTPPMCQTSVPGSIIGCEAQSLGETLPVPGTPFGLNYDSSRLPLYSNWRTLRVGIGPRYGGIPGASWMGVRLSIAIAGKQVLAEGFGPGPATVLDFQWDGLDAFGRPVVGSATATIEGASFGETEYIEYTDEFGRPANYVTRRFRRMYRPFYVSDRSTHIVPAFSPLAGMGSWSLGGWTLSAHHFYDVKGRMLYEGSGRIRAVDPGLYTVERIMGSGGGTTFAPDNTSAKAAGTGVDSSGSGTRFGVAVAPNGDVYYSDQVHSVVRRINSLGQVKTIAGMADDSLASCSKPRGDGGPALLARFSAPQHIAFGPAGELYVYDEGDDTIRRLKPVGPDAFTIDTVAGAPCAPQGNVADNQPTLGTPLPYWLSAIAVGPDGAVYTSSAGDHMIRRLVPGGRTSIVGGNGNTGFTGGNGLVAKAVALGEPRGLAVGADGSVYSSTEYDVYKIRPDGTMQMLSGPVGTPGQPPKTGEPLVSDSVSGCYTLALAPNGTLLFNDSRGATENGVGYLAVTVRALDANGIVRTVGQAPKSPSASWSPPDGAAAMGYSPRSVYALAAGPDGKIYAFGHSSLYRFSSGANSPPTACEDSRVAHIVPDGDIAHCFDDSGRHLSTINWRTRKKLLKFDYDEATGRLASIADANGLVTSAAFANSQYTITAPHLQTTTIEVDENGNATSVGDLLGATVLTPARDGHLEGLTDRNLNDFSFVFQQGRLTEDLSPLSVVPQRLSRSEIPDGFRVTHTSPLLRSTTYDSTRDASGQLLSLVTLPDGTKRIRSERADGGSLSTAPDGTNVTMAASVPDPIWGFRQASQGSRATKLPGGLTLTTSEVSCPPTTSSPPSGPVTTQYSGKAVNPSAALACNPDVPTDPLANQANPLPNQEPLFKNPVHTATKRVWDAQGETVTRTSAAGRLVTETRDAQGRTAAIQVGSLTPVVYSYDTVKTEQLKYLDRGDRRTQLFYSESDEDAGYVAKVKNALGVETSFERDIYGRPYSTEEASNVPSQAATTTLGWDGNGNLGTVGPSGRPLHEITYNSANFLQRYTPPVVAGIPTPQTLYQTNGDRAPLNEGRPDGVSIARGYVPATGQLDTITFSGGTSPSGTLDWDYFASNLANAAGRVQYLKGPYGTTKLTYQYDGSLVTSEGWDGDIPSHPNWGTVAWRYNSRLLKSRETVTPGGTVYFAYDDDGLLTCVSQTGESVGTPAERATCSSALGSTDLSLTRSAEHGLVTGITAGNVTEVIEYSDSASDDGGPDVDAPSNRAFGELRRQTVKFGNTVVAQLTYDSGIDPRDALGRIVTKTEQIHTTPAHDIVYGYDERGRLETVDDGANSEAFTYDANGNRETYSGPGGSIADSSTTYDAQDRLLTYGTKTFQYGHNGELRTVTQAGTTTTYTYDALGNLTKVQKTGAPDIDYIVDGRGRRIGKKRAASSSGPALDRRWIYRNGLSPIAEVDGVTGEIVARYVYGSRPNLPDLVIRDGKSYRLVADQLGSPRMAINVADGTDIRYRVDYSAFGVPKAVGATTLDWIPFGFAGGIVDSDTGLVRFGARDYDASIGRWVSKDPIRFDAAGTNLYAYALNDPVNVVDRDGRNPLVLLGLCAFGGCEAVAAAAAAAAATTVAAIACIASGTCGKVADKIADKIDDICTPRTPTPPDDCAQKCLPYMGPGGAYPGSDGHTYRNDLGGQWAFQRCVAECRGKTIN